MNYWAGFVGVVGLLMATGASATLINFEDAATVHGLGDNDAVTTQYAPAPEGVTFTGAFLEGTYKNGYPDTDPQGFLNDDTGHYDQPFAATPSLGDWFLRTGGEILKRGGQGVYLTVAYSTPVTAASGQIWDIDKSNAGWEQWKVVAYSGGVEVASDLSPQGKRHTTHGSLDGLPWTFNLQYATGFDEIDFVFTGTKDKNIGLGFDNFNTDSLSVSVPEPGAAWLLGMGVFGLLGLAACRTRRREAA